MPTTPLIPDALRPREVAALLGCSEVALRRRVNSGNAPPFYELSPRRRVWSAAEVRTWLQERRVNGGAR